MANSPKPKPVAICLWLHHNKFQARMLMISEVLTTLHTPALPWQGNKLRNRQNFTEHTLPINNHDKHQH